MRFMPVAWGYVWINPGPAPKYQTDNVSSPEDLQLDWSACANQHPPEGDIEQLIYAGRGVEAPMDYNVFVNSKAAKKTLKAEDFATRNGSSGLINKNVSIGNTLEASVRSLAKRDSKLQPWEDAVRGAADRAGHSGEALRRLRTEVRSRRQGLLDFARQHRRHLTLVEFKEFRQLHGAWLEASRALWHYEHPGAPLPEFKLTNV
jgi:hypothetical protein